MRKMIVTKTREGGETPGTEYVTLADDAPEWLHNAVRAAHDGAMPCDWIYETCAAAYEAITEGQDLGDSDECDSFSDSQTEVYTGKLFAWAAEHLRDEHVLRSGSGSF